MGSMQNEDVVLSLAQVDALARVTKSYKCALVDDSECVEQPDGDYDLRATTLPDEERKLYEFDPENPPGTEANDDDVKMVLKLMHQVGGSLWFRTQEAFDQLVEDHEGVSVNDGKLLALTEPLFIEEKVALNWFTIVVKAD